MKTEDVQPPLRIKQELLYLGQLTEVEKHARATEYPHFGVQMGSMRCSPPQLRRRTNHREKTSMMREEIRLLHVKIEELRYDRSLKEALDRLSNKPIALCSSHWKKIAASEQYTRELAVDQNLQLRRRLSVNLKYLRRIQKLLAQRQVVELTSRMPLHTRSTSQDDVYYELKKRMDSRHGKIDVLLQQYEAAISVCRPEYSAFDVHAHGSVTETKLSALKPFDISTINNAIWRYTRQLSQTYHAGTDVFVSGITMRTIDLPSDLRVKFELGSEEHDQTIRTWCLLRRFMLENQLVLMWETLTEFEHEGAQSPSTSHESGWSVIKSLEEFEHRASLTHSTVSVEIHSRVGSQTIQRIMKARGASHERVLENMMMDSMRQRN